MWNVFLVYFFQKKFSACHNSRIEGTLGKTPSSSWSSFSIPPLRRIYLPCLCLPPSQHNFICLLKKELKEVFSFISFFYVLFCRCSRKRKIVFMCVCGGGGNFQLRVRVLRDCGENLKGKHYLAIVDIYIFGYKSGLFAAYKEQCCFLQWDYGGMLRGSFAFRHKWKY